MLSDMRQEHAIWHMYSLDFCAKLHKIPLGMLPSEAYWKLSYFKGDFFEYVF